LDGVGVTVNGKPVAIDYISPTQVTFLMPPDLTPGPVTTNNGLTSTAVSATLSHVPPAFFLASPEFSLSQCSDGNFIAALQANKSPAAGVLPGETVALFATGFGATTPTAPNGQLLNSPLPVVHLPQVSMGGVTAPVSFAALVTPGLYQINVTVPMVDTQQYRFFGVPVSASIPGVAAQACGYIQYDWVDILGFIP